MIPANSTHLQQPLDVAFFAPLQRLWRKLLSEYKSTVHNKGNILKADFPRLLCNLVQELMEKGNGSANLKSGFATCGVCPIDADRVLRKMPGGLARENSDCIVAEVVEKLLSSKLYGDQRAGPSSRRGPQTKRIKVVPGKSVGNADSAEDDSKEY